MICSNERTNLLLKTWFKWYNEDSSILLSSCTFLTVSWLLWENIHPKTSGPWLPGLDYVVSSLYWTTLFPLYNVWFLCCLFAFYLHVSFQSHSLMFVCLATLFFWCIFFWVYLSPFCDLVEKILFGRCWGKHSVALLYVKICFYHKSVRNRPLK